jgi:hypothetical protein
LLILSVGSCSRQRREHLQSIVFTACPFETSPVEAAEGLPLAA